MAVLMGQFIDAGFSVCAAQGNSTGFTFGQMDFTFDMGGAVSPRTHHATLPAGVL